MVQPAAECLRGVAASTVYARFLSLAFYWQTDRTHNTCTRARTLINRAYTTPVCVHRTCTHKHSCQQDLHAVHQLARHLHDYRSHLNPCHPISPLAPRDYSGESLVVNVRARVQVKLALCRPLSGAVIFA